MNKKILTPILLLAGGFLCCTSVLNQNSFNASASYVSQLIVEENFDKKTLNPDTWITNNATLVADHYSMKFTPTRYDWGNHIVLDDYPILASSTVDVVCEAINSSGWFAFSFGSEFEDQPFYNAEAGLIFYGGMNSGVFGYQTELGMETHDKVLYSSPFSSFGTKRLIRFYLDVINDKESTICYDIFTTGGEIVYQHTAQDTYKIPTVLGYMGFSVNKLFTEIYSVSIKDTATKEIYYEDDFSTSGITYTSSGSGSWKTNTQLTESDVVCGPTGYISLKDSGSSVRYANKFENPKNSRIDVYAETSVDIYTGTMDESTSTGIEVGIKSNNEDGFFFGVKKTSTGCFLATKINGEWNIGTEPLITQSGGYVNLSLSFHNDGFADVLCGEVISKINIGDISGYFQICSKAFGTSGNKGGFADDFAFISCENILKNNPDVAMNFNGTKEKEIFGDKYYEFFVPVKEWYKSSDLKLASYNNNPEEAPLHQDGYITFNNSNNKSFFGSRKSYLNYIAKFDVEILTASYDLNESSGLGFGFGMNTFGDFCNNNQAFALVNTTTGSKRIVMTVYNDLFENGEGAIEIPDVAYRDMFDAGRKYNFVIVVNENIVSIYFKSAEAPLSDLDTPKAVIIAESTEGYCGVFGLEGLSFNLDNYSVTNLDLDTPSYEYIEEEDVDGVYQTNTRVDYSTMTSNKGLETDNCSVSQNVLKMNDEGTLTTKAVMRNHVGRLYISSLEEKLSYSVCGIKIEFVNDYSSKQIKIIDSKGTIKLDLSESFDFKGSFFEIVLVGNKLTLKFASGNEALYRYLDNVVEYEVLTSSTYSQLEIESSGITKISAISLLNLDCNQSIESRNFNADIDGVEVWEYREDPNEKKSGCSGSIVVSSCIIAGLSILGSCLILSKKSRKEDR